MQPIKPNSRVIKKYRAALEGYSRQDVEHEGAVRSAFQNLLAETANVRLVGQVIHVSLETVRIIKSLPEEYGG